MSKKLEDGKKYYELRLKGLKNYEIASRCGALYYVVAARICEYRKHANLPIPSSLQQKKEKKSLNKALNDNNTSPELTAENIRKLNHKQAFRRKDGVLQCPTKTCAGFNFDVQNCYNL